MCMPPSRLWGLLARFSHLPLPPSLHILRKLAGHRRQHRPYFVIEFFADKIPAFDLIWSALHTFVRVPVAALLAYGATAQLSPADQLLAAFLGAALALAAHGGKTALRAAVTPSPEPLSLEYHVEFGRRRSSPSGLTWLATRHPYAAAIIVAILVAIILLLARVVIRALRAMFRGAENELAGRPA